MRHLLANKHVLAVLAVLAKAASLGLTVSSLNAHGATPTPPKAALEAAGRFFECAGTDESLAAIREGSSSPSPVILRRFDSAQYKGERFKSTIPIPIFGAEATALGGLEGRGAKRGIAYFAAHLPDARINQVVAAASARHRFRLEAMQKGPAPPIDIIGKAVTGQWRRSPTVTVAFDGSNWANTLNFAKAAGGGVLVVCKMHRQKRLQPSSPPAATPAVAAALPSQPFQPFALPSREVLWGIFDPQAVDTSGPVAVVTLASGAKWNQEAVPGQVSVSSGQVAKKQPIFGWLAEVRVDGVPSPVATRLLIDGGLPKRITIEAEVAIGRWTFVSDDLKVAYLDGPLHGSSGLSAYLFDLRTEKRVGVWRVDSKSSPPRWARGLL